MGRKCQARSLVQGLARAWTSQAPPTPLTTPRTRTSASSPCSRGWLRRGPTGARPTRSGATRTTPTRLTSLTLTASTRPRPRRWRASSSCCRPRGWRQPTRPASPARPLELSLAPRLPSRCCSWAMAPALAATMRPTTCCLSTTGAASTSPGLLAQPPPPAPARSSGRGRNRGGRRSGRRRRLLTLAWGWARRLAARWALRATARASLGACRRSGSRRARSVWVQALQLLGQRSWQQGKGVGCSRSPFLRSCQLVCPRASTLTR
mmetsp:Transcript_5575/g.13900  ORF Transcript_5575/g.13900 Transcript_5575/m.13900 type:complete len:264 (+) Transcript_5575:658-1449(+)